MDKSALPDNGSVVSWYPVPWNGTGTNARVVVEWGYGEVEWNLDITVIPRHRYQCHIPDHTPFIIRPHLHTNDSIFIVCISESHL